MDKIEKIIKEYLSRNLDKTKKTAACLSEQSLMDYFEGKPDQEYCQHIESHLAGCGFCLSQLNLIFQAQQGVYKRDKGTKVPAGYVRRAKELIKADSDMENKKTLRKKKVKKNLFLIGAIMFFVGSFFVPRYFCQFLVITLILGIRWAFESEGGSTLIMVLDSWRRHSYEQNDEISQRLKNRFKSNHL